GGSNICVTPPSTGSWSWSGPSEGEVSSGGGTPLPASPSCVRSPHRCSSTRARDCMSAIAVSGSEDNTCDPVCSWPRASTLSLPRPSRSVYRGPSAAAARRRSSASRTTSGIRGSSRPKAHVLPLHVPSSPPRSVPVLGASRGPGESSSSYPSETDPSNGSSPQRGVADSSNSAVPGVHVSAPCTDCSSGGCGSEELGLQVLPSGAI